MDMCMYVSMSRSQITQMKVSRAWIFAAISSLAEGHSRLYAASRTLSPYFTHAVSRFNQAQLCSSNDVVDC